MVYKEKHRPQFRFSSRRGWNNDPNGLMYYDGEYYMPVGSIPDDDNKSLKVFAGNGEAKIVSLDVNKLKSAWK